MDVKSGYIVSDPEENPAKEAVSFTALITIHDYPGQIHAGFIPLINCKSTRIACKFKRLVSKINRRNGKILEEDPQYIKKGEVAIVEMVPQKPIVVESFAEFASLGIFNINLEKHNIGFGIIKDVQFKEKEADLENIEEFKSPKEKRKEEMII